MIHRGTEKIETKRLILRKFTMQDAEPMYKNWHSDSEVTKFLTWKPVENLDETKKLLEMWISSYKDDNFYQWTIELKEVSEPIGSITAGNINEDVEKITIGYAIGKKWWNCGIMTEALKAVIDFLFSKVHVNRIDSRHDPKNISSGRVMQKCGLKYEGTLRKNEVNNTGIVDSCIYSILRDEWDKSH